MDLDCVLERLNALRAQVGNVKVEVWDGYELRPLLNIDLLELDPEEAGAGEPCLIYIDAEEIPSRQRRKAERERRRSASAQDLLDAQGVIALDEYNRLTPDKE